MANTNITIFKTNAFHAFASLGYKARLLPIVPPDAPLAPGTKLTKASVGKGPGIRSEWGWTGFKRWQDHETTEEELATWHAWGASTGIRTGNGLVAVDIDCLDMACWPAINAARAKHLDPYGKFPERVGRAPKTLILMRTDGEPQRSHLGFGERDEKGNFKQGIDILGRGRQFVAWGPHALTKQLYDWIKPIVAFDELPKVPAAAIDAFIDELREILPGAKAHGAPSGNAVSQRSLRGKTQTVIEAVRRIDNSPANTPYKTRKAWIEDFIYPVKAALPDDDMLALELVLEKAAQWDDSPENEAQVERDFWRCVGPYRRGAGFLYDTVLTYFPGDWHPYFQAHAGPAGGPVEPLGYRDLAAILSGDGVEPVSFLIDHFLVERKVSMAYGQPSAGKSYLALDMAFCIATGRPWHGLPVKQGAVAWLALEGYDDIRNRLQGLAQAYGHEGNAPFYLLDAHALWFSKENEVKALVATLKTIEGLRLLVTDTFAEARGDLEENDTDDMQQMMTTMRGITTAAGCSILALHHTDKQGARGRGNGTIDASADTIFYVRQEGGGRLEVSKQRSFGYKIAFDFSLDNQVQVGEWKPGVPLMSAVPAYGAVEGLPQYVDAVPASSAFRKSAPDKLTGLAASVVGLLNAEPDEWFTAKDIYSLLHDGGTKCSFASIRKLASQLATRRVIASQPVPGWQGKNIKSGMRVEREFRASAPSVSVFD